MTKQIEQIEQRTQEMINGYTFDSAKRAITSIAKSGKALDAKIQEMAIVCLVQAEKHGNVTLGNMLWNAMPKGSRKNALGSFLMQYGKFRVNTGKDKEANRFRLNREGLTNLEAAENNPWFNFKPEKALDSEIDLHLLLRNVVRKIQAASSKGQVIKGSEEEKAIIDSLLLKGNYT